MTDVLDRVAPVDFSKNFIFGSARILIADPTEIAFPTKIDDVVRKDDTSTDEAQTITVTGTPAGGTFTLSFKGATTTALAHSSTAADVVAALEALGTVGPGGVTGTGGPLPGTPVVITFAAQLGGQNVPQMIVTSSLTGGTTPTIVVTTSTAGFGQWDARTGWIDLGPTKGGITIERNSAEQAFDVDQIQANILTLPTDWPTTVSANMAAPDLTLLQYIWEGGEIEYDPVEDEYTLPLGAPTTVRHRRLAVVFQRKSPDGTTPGGVRIYCFRDTTRAAAASQIVHNKTGDQANPAFQWNIYADTTVQNAYGRFGAIIDEKN